MGTDHYAYTVLGVKVPRSKLFIEKQVPNCPHPQKQDEFCSLCGKKNKMIVVEEPIGIYYEEEGHLGSFEALTNDNCQNEIIIVFQHVKSTHRGVIVNFSNNLVEEAKKSLKEFLEPLELWEEDKFGIWCVLISYY